ncbi:formate dehydrogenase accessory sulfurtransferase FdhD [Uliginosibacterium sp. TH139]|uniref:formate dehydrogenase accessory sulfurtransferase FdhD n=1 Tax=Uliginosibacterium sp. TH139 TaxID=2067453 RepID=UPI000C7E5122|nr:formate dehydrogenase accessory sulfurtransferase FdhD [Uliginosibacterium sp. TH139]PLK48856.1 sulfurtransferase FdhD [Uliginosibacterium sp. TH139]
MSCTVPVLPLPGGAPADEADHAPSALVEVLRIQAESRAEQEDEVIEEVPVALSYNGISHAVMLATPTDLEDFALGFSISEGVVENMEEIHDLEVQPGCAGIVIEMQIAQPRFLALKERRRSLAGRTGCGLCGVESLTYAIRPLPEGRLASAASVSVSAIDEAVRQLAHWQPLRQQTGASHAAAWVDGEGRIRMVREDAGRHNALDKLAGAMFRSRHEAGAGFVLVSSRASYEMVQKVVALGAGALVAVSAPTALAIRTAEAAGILLVGFARPGQMVAYCHAERLTGEMPLAGQARRGMM